ncbi:hypothetical protein PQX77_021834 [Marasmius sp. AFHP31]|nr:hypothetical protein PQX77_021834 [Marasmius sp. AFHP31]
MSSSLAPLSASSLSLVDMPQQATGQTPVAIDHKRGAQCIPINYSWSQVLIAETPGNSASRPRTTQRSGGSRSAMSQGSKLAPVTKGEVLKKIDEEYSLLASTISIWEVDAVHRYSTLKEKDLAKKVYVSMAKTYRAALELAASDEPKKGCLATTIFMDRIIVSLGWCPTWIQPRYSKSMYAHMILNFVAANYVNVCLDLAKRLDPVSFTHVFLEGNSIGRDRKDAHPLVKHQNPADVYNNLIDDRANKASSKVGNVKILPKFESRLLELGLALSNAPDNPMTPDTQTNSDKIIKDSATTF